MLTADYHTHTRLSHGIGSPEDNVRTAIEKGISRIAISEHAPAHLFYGVRGAALLGLRREIDRLQKKYGFQIDVLMGIECNLTAFGECDLPKDAGMFDVRLLAYHKGVWPRDAALRRCTREAMLASAAHPEETARALLAAAEKYKINILAHPSLYVKSDICVLSRGAAELGVKLELNAARCSMSEDELRLAVKNGARFLIGSDAHKPERVGEAASATALARAAGILDYIDNLRNQ